MEVTAAGLSLSLRWKEVCIVSVCTSYSRLIHLPAGRREGGGGRRVEGGREGKGIIMSYLCRYKLFLNCWCGHINRLYLASRVSTLLLYQE